MGLKKLQLLINKQSPMRIKPDSLTFLEKRKLKEHYNTRTTHRCCENGTQRDTRSIQRLVHDLCCESRTKFSALTSCGEQDGGYSAEISDGLHVHSTSGREQNSAM